MKQLCELVAWVFLPFEGDPLHPLYPASVWTRLGGWLWAFGQLFSA
jgi:hypothetical protein